MCLVALAEEGSPLARAFEHRFDSIDATGDATRGLGSGSAPPGGAVGHALGNLVLAGLVWATGDLQAAIDEAGRLLGTVGHVVPAAAEPVVLKAESDAGWIEGQTAVRHTGRIRRVALVPGDPPAPARAVDALGQADQVVLGPGSLYTSVLAAAMVPGITRAVADTTARVVYVANLRPEAAETGGYDVAAHVTALLDHGVRVDMVVADLAGIALGAVPVPVVERDLARPNGLAHDPARLAAVLRSLVG